MSLYLGMYLAKSKRVSTDATSDTVSALAKYAARKVAASNGQPSLRSAYSLGLGMLHSGVRGRTSGEAIGAQLAAYLTLGGRCFQFSHQFVTLPLAQAFAMINGQVVRGLIGAKGGVFVSFNDYLCRPVVLEFASKYRLVKRPQKRSKRVQPDPDSTENDRVVSEEADDVSDESDDESRHCHGNARLSAMCDCI